MAMTKKALVYTMGVILFLSIIVIIVVLRHREYAVQDDNVFVSRVQTMDRFINDFERDLERVTFISGYRTLIAMEDSVATTSLPLENATASFLELFINGTINGSSHSIMENSTFVDYLRRIQLNANKTQIVLEADVLDARLYQEDPWHVVASIDLDLHFYDIGGEVGWRFNKTYPTPIPIFDLKDPLYSISTNSRLSNTIIRSPYETFITPSNDTTNLSIHVNNSWYINSTLAPDILMRFEGNLSPSAFGIESIVNIPLLSAQGIPVDTNSTVVDYHYFDSAQHLGDTIINMPLWFKLDNGHLALYDAEGKTT
jgi:hypothetical protein